ncbi:hypothetical protein FGB62_11g018 [Gracilaria domingensis]|nr:hypothetical protein FGB62_11g018 [Gracilaria domingensis]
MFEPSCAQLTFACLIMVLGGSVVDSSVDDMSRGGFAQFGSLRKGGRGGSGKGKGKGGKGFVVGGVSGSSASHSGGKIGKVSLAVIILVFLIFLVLIAFVIWYKCVRRGR